LIFELRFLIKEMKKPQCGERKPTQWAIPGCVPRRTGSAADVSQSATRKLNPEPPRRLPVLRLAAATQRSGDAARTEPSGACIQLQERSQNGEFKPLFELGLAAAHGDFGGGCGSRHHFKLAFLAGDRKIRPPNYG